MKKAEKLRGAEFYNALALKVLEKGTTTQDEFRSLIKLVNSELGFYHRDKYNGTIQKNFEKVFQSCLDVIEEKRDDRGRGKRLMIKVFDFKTKDQDEILSVGRKYFSTGNTKPRKPEHPVTTLSEADKTYRDAYVGEARRIQDENPGTDRRVAVKIAKRNVRKLSKDFIKKIWKILTLFNQNEYREIISSKLKETLSGVITKQEPKKWSDQLIPYGVKFHVTVTDYPQDNRKWILKLHNDPTELMMVLANIAKKMYGMELQIPSGEKPMGKYKRLEGTRQNLPASSEEYISPRVKYIVFAMAGIIQKQHSFVDINLVTAILRKNHYRSINVTNQEILDIVKAFPDYFEKSIQRGSIGLKGRDIWDKVQKFNPKNEEWLIPWVVNSGLKLEDIQKFFPSSTELYPEKGTGSSVFMIKTDRSIGAFMKLAKLQLLMRDCDFPISEEGLLDRLNNENTISEKLLQAIMLDRRTSTFEQETETDQDKMLYQIEENYM